MVPTFRSWRGETAQYEDALDRYRHEVERLLGDQLRFEHEDDFESFFEHVVSCFERRIDGETCALTWLTKAAAPSRHPR